MMDLNTMIAVAVAQHQQAQRAGGFRAGDKVRFKQPWDIYPHAMIDAGESGTVTSTNEYLSIRMDKHHDGLDEWENVVYLDFECFVDEAQTPENKARLTAEFVERLS